MNTTKRNFHHINVRAVPSHKVIRSNQFSDRDDSVYKSIYDINIRKVVYDPHMSPTYILKLLHYKQ